MSKIDPKTAALRKQLKFLETVIDGQAKQLVENEAKFVCDRAALNSDIGVLQERLRGRDETINVLRAKNDAFDKEINSLRDRLMTSELAYAKVVGYLDRIEDERPPLMVPQERERFKSQIPDGTMGSDYGGWRGAGYGEQQKRWYHR